MLALKAWAAKPPTKNGLLAYKSLTQCVNEVEDQVFGETLWNCPRTFLNGERTDRIYTILSESFYEVPSFPGVSLLLAKDELIFISRFGAAEVQNKLIDDKYGEAIPYEQRSNEVIFSKLDASGDGVWHVKNKN